METFPEFHQEVSQLIDRGIALPGKSPFKQIMAAAELGLGNLVGSDLSGTDFSHQDLTGVDFSECDCRGVNWEKANIAGCRFKNTRLDLWAIFLARNAHLATF